MFRFGLLFLIGIYAYYPASIAKAAEAEKPVLPRRYDRPPNEPLSPTEAAARMTVPPGFKVEVVAAEPDLVNPVAMTFDERGRIWLSESLEYPRHSAGPGRDRIKVLEDIDNDGRVDKVTIFAEGLNIPSGIAIGAGGVWVANAPDILFLQDTDGDGRADKSEVVVTGFGRADTHELPNSLTWGPDGWLYGLNGVFNPSRIEYRGRVHEFTCAMFRIHPITRDFEIFCEGTSNPWGIAFNHEGDAFVSATTIAKVGPIRRLHGRSNRSSSTNTRRLLTAVSIGSTATRTPSSFASGCSWATCMATVSTSIDFSATAAPTVGCPSPISSLPTTIGSCRSCRRPAPMAACTFSTGTTSTIAIKMRCAIRRVLIVSRGACIA
jgi:putative membrane-bound dehydrogenase-like protein